MYILYIVFMYVLDYMSHLVCKKEFQKDISDAFCRLD